MLISLTVGKVDAGVAVLLTEDKRLIEFPSILLPPSITSGSIVDITVSRNLSSESASQKSFAALQSSILQTYGLESPSPPVLRCRNATQTSIVLEWDKLQLATASFKSLSLFRNGAKAGNIPFQPGGKREVVLSTKISGLAVDTEYVFHLVLRTSAGTYSSDKLRVRTHKMTDLTGITVTPGVLPAPLLTSLKTAADRIGAKIAESVRIDTTHFVCTEGRGKEWERAVEMNIPVVRPEWVEGCEREGRIVGVRAYYLNADPKLRQAGQGIGRMVIQQSPAQPDGVDRRDMAPPAARASREDVQEEPSSERQQPDDGIKSPPPPPTPAKDYREDPMGRVIPRIKEPNDDDDESGDDSEGEEREASAPAPAPAAAGDVNDHSQAVSPTESDDDDDDEDDRGPPDDLGITGLRKKGQTAASRGKGDDEEEEVEEDERKEVKSPEESGSFSEVQL